MQLSEKAPGFDSHRLETMGVTAVLAVGTALRGDKGEPCRSGSLILPLGLLLSQGSEAKLTLMPVLLSQRTLQAVKRELPAAPQFSADLGL